MGHLPQLLHIIGHLLLVRQIVEAFNNLVRVDELDELLQFP